MVLQDLDFLFGDFFSLFQHFNKLLNFFTLFFSWPEKLLLKNLPDLTEVPIYFQ